MAIGCSARAQQASSCSIAWALGDDVNCRAADTRCAIYTVHLQLLSSKHNCSNELPASYTSQAQAGPDDKLLTSQVWGLSIPLTIGAYACLSC